MNPLIEKSHYINVMEIGVLNIHFLIIIGKYLNVLLMGFVLEARLGSDANLSSFCP